MLQKQSILNKSCSSIKLFIENKYYSSKNPEKKCITGFLGCNNTLMSRFKTYHHISFMIKILLILWCDCKWIDLDLVLIT